MGSCCGNETPTPPSPLATASAQTAQNVNTAQANQAINQVNQITPEGYLNYEQRGTYTFTDPTNGTQYNLPQYTAVQGLSPQNAQIKAQQDAAKYTMASTANTAAGDMQRLLSTGVDINSAPIGGSYEWIKQADAPITGYSSGTAIQNQLGDAGNITRDYGPADNYSADRSRVEESLYGRLNPQLERDRAGIEQRLADQGIRYGSQAYASAMDDYNRQSTDARLAVTAAGGAEQQRMNQMAAERAGFQNTAQQQAFQQQLGRGQFANAAQGQQYTQNAAQAAFYNSAAAQGLARGQSIFNAAQAQRSSRLNELYAQRNQPINEISALMSGSQVSPQNFVNAPSTQIPTTDVGGLINTGFNQQMQIANQQNQNVNQLIGGALGAAGNIYASDERVKKDIKKIGTVFAYDADKDEPKSKMGSVISDKEELPIYEYRYKGARDDGQRHVGPMAQDVEKLDPKAVKNIGGVKHIDRRRLMGGILRAA